MAKVFKLKKHVEADVDEGSEAKGGWMSNGFEPVKKHAEEIEQRKKSGGGFALNFWLQEDESAEVRFMSGEPINIFEHNIRIDGKFAQRTCLQGTGEKCPLCERGDKKRFVGVFCVIDRRTNKWTSKGDGKKHVEVNQVKMWRCGHRILGMLEKFIAKRGKLTGYDIEVTRSGAGTDTIYNMIPGDWLKVAEDKEKQPLDLLKILKPKSRVELLRELGGAVKDDDEEVVKGKWGDEDEK